MLLRKLKVPWNDGSKGTPPSSIWRCFRDRFAQKHPARSKTCGVDGVPRSGVIQHSSRYSCSTDAKLCIAGTQTRGNTYSRFGSRTP